MKVLHDYLFGKILHYNLYLALYSYINQPGSNRLGNRFGGAPRAAGFNKFVQ